MTPLFDAIATAPWTYQRVRAAHGNHVVAFDRLWLDYPAAGPGGRLWLHRHEAQNEPEFMHHHSWRAAIFVLGPDPYEVEFGYGPPNDFGQPPPVASRVRTNGSPFTYEMTHPWCWHAIRPLGQVYTIMVTTTEWPAAPEPLGAMFVPTANAFALRKAIEDAFTRCPQPSASTAPESPRSA